MAHFWAIKAEKIQDFEFLQGYRYSNTLEGTKEKILGSFQPKLMSKFKVISQKPSKNWIFGQNGHFLTVFGQKWPIFEFFSKIRYEHFFYIPKALSNCQVSEKTNERMSRYLRDIRTYVRTYVHTRVNL